ncbi:MAG: hypothetical protein COC01_05210 [Bacteroidetes bacterium]|nr:MAG: hypothetical protein COC01_05210 [Bacteroidota bacterium]
MRTVLFDSRANFVNNFSAMYKCFEEDSSYGINPVIVYHDKTTFRENSSINNKEILSNYWDKGKSKYSIEELRKMEKDYFDINLWNMVASDRFIHNKDQDYIISQISFFIYAWEEIILKYTPKFVVTETVTGIWNYILFALCQKHNICFLGFSRTKITNRYYYTRDIYGHFPEMYNKYKQLQHRDLTGNELNTVLDYIKGYKNKPAIPVYMKTTSLPPSIKRSFNPYRVGVNIIKDLMQRFISKHHDYTLSYRLKAQYFEWQRLYRVNYTKLFKVFKQPGYNQKYILYPVHYQPEATVEIWASYYSNQLETIIKLAKSIPIDHMLYVKEHRAVLGSKPITFYKNLKKMPNVRLISPSADITELIKNAKAIAILTGTVGLEAIFWNKPVIIFGQVFFDFYPFLIKVDHIENLPNLIKKAIEQRIDENDERKMKFLYSYITSGYSGDIYSAEITKSEAEILCKELVQEIESSN